MRLVESGVLDLDAPIRNYLPDFRMRDADVTARVTMRHLMTHTGGWEGDYFLDTGDGDDALERYVAAMAELPQLTPLGTQWSYNNAAFYARRPRDREDHRQDFRGGAQGAGDRSARPAPLVHLPARRDGPSVRRRPRFDQRADLRAGAVGVAAIELAGGWNRSVGDGPCALRTLSSWRRPQCDPAIRF